MARSLALFLAASLVAASPAERAPKTLSAQGAVPEGGKCKNEIVDDKVTGNHCVLVSFRGRKPFTACAHTAPPHSDPDVRVRVHACDYS